MTPQTLGALDDDALAQRAELAVLGAAAAPIRRGSKVWRGAARKA